MGELPYARTKCFLTLRRGRIKATKEEGISRDGSRTAVKTSRRRAASSGVTEYGG
jgi:hypothetical protein